MLIPKRVLAVLAGGALTIGATAPAHAYYYGYSVTQGYNNGYRKVIATVTEAATALVKAGAIAEVMTVAKMSGMTKVMTKVMTPENPMA